MADRKWCYQRDASPASLSTNIYRRSLKGSQVRSNIVWKRCLYLGKDNDLEHNLPVYAQCAYLVVQYIYLSQTEGKRGFASVSKVTAKRALIVLGLPYYSNINDISLRARPCSAQIENPLWISRVKCSMCSTITDLGSPQPTNESDPDGDQRPLLLNA